MLQVRPVRWERYRGPREGGGRSSNGIRYPSRRTDTTQGSAPIARHCRQWHDRHPPYTQRRCGRVRSSAFWTLCLYHRSCRNGRWAGKRAGVICRPCSTCYPSVRTPGWCYEAFAVDGELAESFATYPPTGRWRRTCCCPVAVAWECGAGAGPYGRGHRWRLSGPC